MSNLTLDFKPLLNEAIVLNKALVRLELIYYEIRASIYYYTFYNRSFLYLVALRHYIRLDSKHSNTTFMLLSFLSV